MNNSSVRDALEIFEVDSTTKFSKGILRDMLQDVETTLFFAKVYDLDYDKLVELLQITCSGAVLTELLAGNHSKELQTYIINTVPPAVLKQAHPKFVKAPPPGEVLPELWASLSLEIADSIKKVAEKVKHTVHLMPGKQGKMFFSHMAQLNKQRPKTIGTFGAGIKHDRQLPNLIIVDDSSSVSKHTVLTLLDDVIALAYEANAHLVLVSNTARHWEPGAYSRDAIAAVIENQGTHYETLAPLLDRHWGTVVCIADYDSSVAAHDHIRNNARGKIELVLDVSLVDRPTYLAECVGQIAAEVRPLLVGNTNYVLR